MKRLLLALAAMMLFAQAAVAQVTVRIFFVIEQTYAKPYLNSTGGVANWVTQQISALNQAAYFSAMIPRYEAAGLTISGPGYSDTLRCCGMNSGIKDDMYTHWNALEWAARDVAIAEQRDLRGADIVVLVTKFPNDQETGRSLMDCTKTGKAAARTAYVAVPVGITGPLTAEVGRQIGKAMCAGDSDQPTGTNRGYWWMTGSNSSNCMVYGTLMAKVEQKVASVWYTTLSNLPVSGSGSSAFAALSDATPRCPTKNGLNGSNYTCVPIGCTVTGDSAVCTHNTTTTAITPPPPPATTTNTDAAARNTITCNNFTQVGLHSNPAWVWNGYPIGDATHNNVAALNARLPDTVTYRQTQIAKILKAAIQAAQEK